MSKNKVFTGQRDKRIEVVKYTKTRNDLREVVEAEVSVGFFWASLQDLSQNETIEGKVIHVINRAYTMLYNESVSSGGDHMVVKDEGKVFQVYHVEEIGRKSQLLLKCKVRE